MSTPTEAPPPRRTPVRGPVRPGLVTFAAIALFLVGSFNILDGIVALADDQRFNGDRLLFGDLSAWGFWWIFIGLLQLFAGSQVMQMKDVGMMMGIAFAGLNAFTQLMFLDVYPAWAIVIMVIDFIVIYALATSADDFE
jgi:hypothetical protein